MDYDHIGLYPMDKCIPSKLNLNDANKITPSHHHYSGTLESQMFALSTLYSVDNQHNSLGAGELSSSVISSTTSTMDSDSMAELTNWTLPDYNTFHFANDPNQCWINNNGKDKCHPEKQNPMYLQSDNKKR